MEKKEIVGDCVISSGLIKCMDIKLGIVMNMSVSGIKYYCINNPGCYLHILN